MPKDCSTLTVTEVPDETPGNGGISTRHLAAGGLLLGSVGYYLRERGGN